MKPPVSMAIVLVVASLSDADVAPKGMTKFNVVCPSQALCPKLESEYQRCRGHRKEAICAPFVDAMILAFPPHDCQRSVDQSESVNYIVPALWMCEDPRRSGGEPRNYAYWRLLSELNFTKARCAFSSSEFRSTLDGELAEMYREPSLEAAKTVKCPGRQAAGR